MPDAYTVVRTPVGPLTLAATAEALTALRWGDVRTAFDDLPERADHPMLTQAADEVGAYFAGTLTAFSVPLDLRGTLFQQAVWTKLQTIPYGETMTYGELAQRLGRPGAAQAIGTAVARNPVGLFVPCHRVIGADGGLVGFAGGKETKAYLLQLERGHRAPDFVRQGSLFG